MHCSDISEEDEESLDECSDKHCTPRPCLTANSTSQCLYLPQNQYKTDTKLKQNYICDKNNENPITKPKPKTVQTRYRISDSTRV